MHCYQLFTVLQNGKRVFGFREPNPSSTLLLPWARRYSKPYYDELQTHEPTALVTQAHGFSTKK